MEINATLGRSVVRSTPTLPGHPREPGSKYRRPGCRRLVADAAMLVLSDHLSASIQCATVSAAARLHFTVESCNRDTQQAGRNQDLLCSCYDLARSEPCRTYCPILVCRVAKWRQSQGGWRRVVTVWRGCWCLRLAKTMGVPIGGIRSVRMHS
jgi:hypothetical protein